jgi:hypothetical protein
MSVCIDHASQAYKHRKLHMSWPEMDHATPQAQGEEKSAGDPGGGKGIPQQGGDDMGTGNCTDN